MPLEARGRWFRNTRPAGRPTTGWQAPRWVWSVSSCGSEGGGFDPSPGIIQALCGCPARRDSTPSCGLAARSPGPPRAPSGPQLGPCPRLGSPAPAQLPNSPRPMRRARAARIVHSSPWFFLSLPFSSETDPWGGGWGWEGDGTKIGNSSTHP